MRLRKTAPIPAGSAMVRSVKPTRTPLARVGHPAKRPAASRMRLKTCAVEGRRDASTTDAESADVSESDEDRLLGQVMSSTIHPPLLLYDFIDASHAAPPPFRPRAAQPCPAPCVGAGGEIGQEKVEEKQSASKRPDTVRGGRTRERAKDWREERQQEWRKEERTHRRGLGNERWEARSASNCASETRRYLLRVAAVLLPHPTLHKT